MSDGNYYKKAKIFPKATLIYQYQINHSKDSKRKFTKMLILEQNDLNIDNIINIF